MGIGIGAVANGEGSGELGAEEEDLGRVIDPGDENNYRSSGAISGGVTGAAQLDSKN
jgi:endo-1,4-beta-D-glucanase Y